MLKHSHVPMNLTLVMMAACFLSLTVVIADAVAYPLMIVPPLPGGRETPPVLWALLMLPVPLVAFLVGCFLRGRELLVAGLATGVLVQLYGALAAMLDSPGYVKSYAIETPWLFWTVGLVMVSACSTVLLTLGAALRRLIGPIDSW